MNTRTFEIILGVVAAGLLAYLGWVGLTLVDVRTNLQSVDGKVTATSSRIDRIVAILPGWRIRIAEEELAKPLRFALVSIKPKKISADEWLSAVHLVDFEKHQRVLYKTKLKSGDDQRLTALLAGSVKLSGERALSFKEVKTLSAETDMELIGLKKITFPDYINADGSFVIRDAAERQELINTVRRVLEEEGTGGKPEVFKLKTSGIVTVDEFFKELRASAAAYNVPAPKD